MTDELVNKGQRDRSHICLERKAEIRFWSRHLGISEQDLLRVVEKVGNSAATVRREVGLAKQGDDALAKT
jgi:hypothetical protein